MGEKNNVYGENHPTDEAKHERGIREEETEKKGTGEVLEGQREQNPREGEKPQGEWHSPEDTEAPRD